MRAHPRIAALAAVILCAFAHPSFAQEVGQLPGKAGDAPLFAPGDGLSGEAAAAFAEGRCPTYGMLRRSATALAAPYPLPDLPGSFAEGCVYGVNNGDVHLLFVLTEGREFQPVGAPIEDGRISEAPPLYGHVPRIASDARFREANALIAEGEAVAVQRLVEPSADEARATLSAEWSVPRVAARPDGTNAFSLRGTALIVQDDVDPEGPLGTMTGLLGAFAGDAPEWRNTLRPGLAAAIPEGRTLAAAAPLDPLSPVTPLGPLYAEFERTGPTVTAFWWHPAGGFAQCSRGRLDGTVIEGAHAGRGAEGTFARRAEERLDLLRLPFVMAPLPAGSDDPFAVPEAAALGADCRRVLG